MAAAVRELWQAQVHLLVIILAPCLGEHMPTVKADGVRLRLGKTGALAPIPWPGAKALCEGVQEQGPSLQVWPRRALWDRGALSPERRTETTHELVGMQAQGSTFTA